MEDPGRDTGFSFDLSTGRFSYEDGEITTKIGKFEDMDPLDRQAAIILSDEKAWDLYHDMDIYELEKSFRAWGAEIEKTPEWRRTYRNRIFKASQIIERCTGVPYDTADWKRLSFKISKLFGYYSSKVSKGYYDRDRGKSYSKTAYTLKRDLTKMPPYSLKLRLEWLLENGMAVSARTMRVGKSLRPGQAENPRIQAKMDKRSKMRREQMNEYHRAYLAKRAAEHGEDSGRADG